jgi:hypothetical protein
MNWPFGVVGFGQPSPKLSEPGKLTCSSSARRENGDRKSINGLCFGENFPPFSMPGANRGPARRLEDQTRGGVELNPPRDGFQSGISGCRQAIPWPEKPRATNLAELP